MADEPHPQPDEIHRRISELAYLLWEAGGRRHDHALEYWLVAEHEVLSAIELRTEQVLAWPDADGADEPLDRLPRE
jgi:hypothetical protein